MINDSNKGQEMDVDTVARTGGDLEITVVVEKSQPECPPSAAFNGTFCRKSDDGQSRDLRALSLSPNEDMIKIIRK